MQKGLRCSWGHPGNVQGKIGGTGLERTKGEEVKRTKRRRWTSSIYSNQCIRYTAERRRLALDCGFNFRGVRPVSPPSSTRRLQGHGSLNMKYAPLIVHGYSPLSMSSSSSPSRRLVSRNGTLKPFFLLRYFHWNKIINTFFMKWLYIFTFDGTWN